MKKGYLTTEKGLQEYLDVINRISANWSEDPAFGWTDPDAEKLFGAKINFPGASSDSSDGMQASIEHYSKENALSFSLSPGLEDCLPDGQYDCKRIRNQRFDDWQTEFNKAKDSISKLRFPPGSQERLLTRTKVISPESFIHLVTQHNIDIHDVEPVGSDGIEEKPFGFVELLEDSDWYFYTFDWRSYANLNPKGAYDEIDWATWDDMVKASLPLAVELLGRSFVDRPFGQSREEYYKSSAVKNAIEGFIDAGYVEFGGYTIEARQDPTSPTDQQKLKELKAKHKTLEQNDPDQALIVAGQIEDMEEHISNFNPGLTFLIGISKPAVERLKPDAIPGAGLEDLAPERAILISVESIDEDFDEIAETLMTYHTIREDQAMEVKIRSPEMLSLATKWARPTSMDYTPGFSFEKEAELIQEFKEALKTLLRESLTGGGGLSERATAEETEEWATYKEVWNKPQNIVEIGVTSVDAGKTYAPSLGTKGFPDWAIAYVREYAPVTEFKFSSGRKPKKPVSTVPGLIGVQRLGEVKHSRIIGGGFNASLESVFNDFVNSPGPNDIRTLHFVSTMHKGNNSKYKSDIDPKAHFDINPETGFPNLGFEPFVKKYIGPPTHTVEYISGNAIKYQKGIDKYLQDHGGPIASHAQRNVASSMSNSPSWGQKYMVEYSRKWVNNQKDEFWQTLPERRDRLRIDAGLNPLTTIFKQVLGQADVKALVNQAIKCWLDPNEWLEIACRYAMKELGGDAFFERIAKDGTLDKLMATAEIATEIAAAANTIEQQKRIQKAEYQQLQGESDRYNAGIQELAGRRAVLQSEIDNPETTDAERKSLSKDMKALETEEKALIGRRRQVEMDSAYAHANSSTGTYMPSSYLGVSNAEVAQAANDISKSLRKISDPNFKKELCRNIISYSANAVDLLVGLSKGIADQFKEDKKGKKKDAVGDRYAEEKDAERPRDKTTKFGSYMEEAMRAMAAQVAHALILFFVKKLLTEVILACQNLKNALWDNLNRKKPGKKNYLPGKANFDDLMAATPSAAARDLVKKLGAQVDVVESAEDISNLMEDMELLLSQVELCALLNNGEATLSVSKIVKNLLMTRYENLYFQLKGGAKTLSYEKMKKFFMTFQGYIDPKYCEEIQKRLPTQLYSECEIPPYVHELCGELLEGHATKEEIENVCNRAKLDRIEKILGFIDKAYNPEQIAPDDCSNPNRTPHDMYPTNMINDTLIDQNLRTIDPGFKSEMFRFKNKLLTGYASGFPPLGDLAPKSSEKPWQSQQAGGLGEIPDRPILPTIRDSLSRSTMIGVATPPFLWAPGFRQGGEAEKLVNSFVLVSPLANPWSAQTLGGSEIRTSDVIEYYFSVDNPYKQIIATEYWMGATQFRFYNVIENKISVFDNIKDQIKKYLYLYTKDAVTVEKDEGALGGPRVNVPVVWPPDANIAAGITKAEPGPNGTYHSPLEKEFFSLLNKNFLEGMFNTYAEQPNPEGYPSASYSEQYLEKMFNIVTRDLGNNLIDMVRRSPTFHPEGKEMFEKFFSGFFPREVFPADEACDIKDVSFLKIENIKQRARDRNKDLHCGCPPPDIDKETPNLSRSIAEGIIYILARLYTVETFLRLLPVSTVFKIKDVLISETIVDFIVSNMVHELAILDYKNTFKTTTGDKKENLKAPSDKSGPQRIVTPSGKIVFVDEPATKVIAPKEGKPFEPKFQSHVVYYANKILAAKIKEATKRGYELLDPLTEEPYGYTDSDPCSPAGPTGDPYGLDGIKYLIKEQIISVSDFMEKEFESRLDIKIKSWKHSVLSSFLWQHLTKGYGYNEAPILGGGSGKFDIGKFYQRQLYEQPSGQLLDIGQDNFFDLMPKIAIVNPDPNGGTDPDNPDFQVPTWAPYFLTKPRLYSHVMNRYTGKLHIATTGTGDTLVLGVDEEVSEFDADTGQYQQEFFAAWQEDHLNGVNRKANIQHSGRDVVASTLSALSKIGPHGGFLLQPYIRVKQHTKIEDPIVEHPTDDATPEEKKAKAQKKFDQVLNKMLSWGLVGIIPPLSTAIIGALDIDAKLADLYTEWYNDTGHLCEQTADPSTSPAEFLICIKAMWKEHAMAVAIEEYNKVLNGAYPSSFAPSVKNDLPPELGVTAGGDGAYLNINQWREAMTDENFGVAKYKNSIQANEPHTNYFDHWMYGLRLVYVLPLEYDYAEGAGKDQKTYADESRRLHSDIGSSQAVSLGSHDSEGHGPGLLGSFNTGLIKGLPGQAGKQQISTLLSKKTHILFEQLEGTRIGTGNNLTGTPFTPQIGKDISPPIIEVPLIEVELPVGDLDLTNKGELYNFYEKKAKEEGNSDEEAKIIADNAMKEINTPVPLGYFSYQDSITDEFPLDRLLDLMTKTNDFEEIFGRIFPIENYKTLISLYVLTQTFELDEYTEIAKYEYDTGLKDVNGGDIWENITELKGGMFTKTKEMLRSTFYSNTQAADAVKGGAPASSADQANQTEDTGEDSWWDKFQTLMLGSPPSYAQIFAMTPLGIMKGMVQATDPAWKKCNPFFMTPWTPAGFTMCLLNKYLGGPWFGNKADDWLKSNEAKALDCPEDKVKELSTEDYTADEITFDVLMKDYNVMEDDRNWILRKTYNSKTATLAYLRKDNPEYTVDNAYAYKKFSDTDLFKNLVAAVKIGGITPDMDLEVIFSTLREYYDTYIELETQAIEYTKKYKRLIYSVAELYFTSKAQSPAGAVLPGWDAMAPFLSILYFDCATIDFTQPEFESDLRALCDAKFLFKSTKKQLYALESIYNDVLAGADPSNKIQPLALIEKELPSAEEFWWYRQDEWEQIFSKVSFKGEHVSIFEAGDEKQQIQEKLIELTNGETTVPWTIKFPYSDAHWEGKNCTGNWRDGKIHRYGSQLFKKDSLHGKALYLRVGSPDNPNEPMYIYQGTCDKDLGWSWDDLDFGSTSTKIGVKEMNLSEIGGEQNQWGSFAITHKGAGEFVYLATSIWYSLKHFIAENNLENILKVKLVDVEGEETDVTDRDGNGYGGLNRGHIELQITGLATAPFGPLIDEMNGEIQVIPTAIGGINDPYGVMGTEPPC